MLALFAPLCRHTAYSPAQAAVYVGMAALTKAFNVLPGSPVLHLAILIVLLLTIPVGCGC
jgi:hypothetical protein